MLLPIPAINIALLTEGGAGPSNGGIQETLRLILGLHLSLGLHLFSLREHRLRHYRRLTFGLTNCLLSLPGASTSPYLSYTFEIEISIDSSPNLKFFALSIAAAGLISTASVSSPR